jgi:succinyl-diaminopimelate desuccinylase
MQELFVNDGFDVLNVDNYVVSASYGDTKDYVLIIGHLDVVPAGTGWDTPPYTPTIRDNKIFARGAEDDKGGTIAAYYALKILKELGVKFNKRVKFLAATDEESGSRCVSYYFKKYPEQPVSGFIPDADFPLIYGEKAITGFMIEAINDNPNLISIDGGFRLNMVPESATAVIKSLVNKNNEKELLSEYKLLDPDFIADIKYNDDLASITVKGISAHGSTPDVGVNAIVKLAKFIKFILKDSNIASLIIDKLSSTHGESMNINYIDPEMGDVSNNLGIVKTTGNTVVFGLNIRYPKGVVFSNMENNIKESISPYKASVSQSHEGSYLFVDKDSPLCSTLYSAYTKYTNDTVNKPFCIGGGTFARVASNLVAFGPHFLDSEDCRIHNSNEFIEIDNLLKATIIYTEALYNLIK